VRELAQLGRRVLGVAERLGQKSGGIRLLVLQGAAGKLQRDDRVDQPLLRAVVQIADHPRRSSSVAATIRARDAARSSRDAASSSRASVFEIAVATSSVKAAIRDSVSTGSGRSPFEETIITPPEALVNDDRGAHRRAETQLPALMRPQDRTHSRSRASAQGARSAHDPTMLSACGADSCADRFVISRDTPGGDAGRRAVELVARHVRRVDTKKQTDLTRDRRKHDGRGDAAGDQRRHAPQRGLLVRERASSCRSRCSRSSWRPAP
jgi:hypothetical protein